MTRIAENDPWCLRIGPIEQIIIDGVREAFRDVFVCDGFDQIHFWKEGPALHYKYRIDDAVASPAAVRRNCWRHVPRSYFPSHPRQR